MKRLSFAFVLASLALSISAQAADINETVQVVERNGSKVSSGDMAQVEVDLIKKTVTVKMGRTSPMVASIREEKSMCGARTLQASAFESDAGFENSLSITVRDWRNLSCPEQVNAEDKAAVGHLEVEIFEQQVAARVRVDNYSWVLRK